jgi:hypothetical protein
MKRYSFLLCLFLLPFIGLAQQSPERKTVELGFTVSPNIGWMRVTNSMDGAVTSNGSRAGISYGVLADVGFTSNYYFSTAFVLTSVNSKLSEVDPLLSGATPVLTTYKLQYIEIPLTLKLKSNPLEFGKFYGQFGLGTGVKISGKESIDGAGDNKSEAANTFRVALVAGGGVEWDINSNFRVQTGLIFNHGLSNTISSVRDIRSDYLALSLGVFF